MTVKELTDKCCLNAIALPTPDKEVAGAYVGDLLSWVMGKADAGNVWITIMSNINIVAVATLTDVSCIVLAEGVSPDADALSTAEAKGINILSTGLSSYEAAVLVSRFIK